MPRPSKWRERLTDEVIFEAVDLLTKGKHPEEIARLLRPRLGDSFNRGHITGLIKLAKDKGLLSLSPPHAADVARKIEVRFDLHLESVHVVAFRGRDAVDHLAAATASLVMKRIARQTRSKVHIGLGSGRTTHLVCARLGAMLRADPNRPELIIHGLTSGWDPGTSIESPVSHFSHFLFFDQPHPAVTFVGLSIPPLIPAGRFDEIVRLPLVKEAFDQKDDLDIVITSIGSKEDKDCTFKRTIDSPRIAHNYGSLRRSLDLKGWVGDVQFLPYSDTEAIEMKHLKPGVLVSFEQLVAMAERKDKDVVVVVGPCGLCGNLKTAALRPLLAQKKLRVFSDLVLDLSTAEALLT